MFLPRSGGNGENSLSTYRVAESVNHLPRKKKESLRKVKDQTVIALRERANPVSGGSEQHRN